MSIKSKLITVAGVVGALIVAAVAREGSRVAANEGIDAYQRHEAANGIDALEKEGPFAETLQELRKVDPSRADALVAEMKHVVTTTSSPAEAQTQMLEYSKRMMADYRKAAPQASDAKVRDVAEAKLAMLKVVREQSAEECGRLAATGPFAGMTNTQELRDAVGKASLAVIRAGAEGMRHPVARPQPAALDYGPLVGRMRAAGITEAELDALEKGTTSILPVERQCALFIDMYEEALAMRGPASANILAGLLVE